MSYAIAPGLRARAFFRWEEREFFFGSTTPGFNRDGEVTRGGGDLAWAFPAHWLWGASWVRLGYRVRRENAVGSQFDAYGHEPVVTLSLILPESVSLNLDGRIEWREYDHTSSFEPSAGIREDVIGQLRTAFRRSLGKSLSLELVYAYTNRSSNVDIFDYRRHELTALTTYHY